MAGSLRRVALALALAVPGTALAFTVNISSGDRAIYLRVGTGAYSGISYSSWTGTLGDSSVVNTVSAVVPATQVGNGTPVAMTVDGGNAQAISHWDNYQFCNANSQVYIGGFYRRPGNGNGAGNAQLTVTTPATLTSTDGSAIPITQISWTTSGNGDGAFQPVPAGTFSGGQQTLASFPPNSWRESCMTFRYANAAAVAAGTYTARATYTLTSP